MSLVELERALRESLENEATELAKLRDAIRAHSPLSRDGIEITKAILLRMKSYYDGQNKIKAMLNKRYLSAASDFFVESVLFYLTLFCEFHSSQLDIHSERQIKKKRGSMRPDISVWSGEDVVGIIECKTQLGWNRDKWDTDFQYRVSQLNEAFPAARAYLLVMTSENWGGFPEGDMRVGQQFFTLSSVWPTSITSDNLDHVIVNPIERLFNNIITGHNGA